MSIFNQACKLWMGIKDNIHSVNTVNHFTYLIYNSKFQLIL